MGTVVDKVAFESPPVRSVHLGLFFEPISGLQVSHFSALREAWRDKYPNSAELPPLRPRNRDGEESSIVPITSSWPIPYVTLSSDGDETSIAFQDDRFIKSWRFSELAGGRYPGFEQLVSDLASEFSQFQDVVEHEMGDRFHLVSSSCTYRNSISGLSPTELMVGLATRWQTSADEPAYPAELNYAGMHLHLGPDDVDQRCSLHLTLDWDQDDEATLTIDSSYDVGPEESKVELGGLRTAHQRLIETFLNYTNSDMHNSWGRK